MTVSDILDRAAERLSKLGAWTQGHDAQNARGIDVRPRRPSAVCWCVYGALEAEATDEEMWSVTKVLRDHIGGGMISKWNDAPSRTQAEVVATLREAAAKAREQGK